MRATVVLLLLAAHAAAGEPPEIALARAKQSYARGEFPQVVRALEPLLYPAVQVNADDELVAHKLLGLCYFFQNDLARAEREFTTLLQLNGEFALDPAFDPPPAIALLDAIRVRNRAQLEEIARQKQRDQEEHARVEEARRRAEEERIRRSQKPVIVERELHRLAIAFVPFGAGQVQNHQTTKAWLLGASQLALALSSLGLWSYLEIKYQNGQRPVPASESRTANAVSTAAIVTGALFWVDVAAGIVDALFHFRRTVTLTPSMLEGGSGLVLTGAF